MIYPITKSQARRIWLRAQRLDQWAPCGDGADATRAAVEHLGYVQIDTINVIERCHHHILYTRIPGCQRAHLRQAQSVDKSAFEYWTLALSYLPTGDLRFYVRAMKRDWHRRSVWFSAVKKVRKVVVRIRRQAHSRSRSRSIGCGLRRSKLLSMPAKGCMQVARGNVRFLCNSDIAACTSVEVG